MLRLSGGREARLSPLGVPRQRWRGRPSIAPVKRLAARARERLAELVTGRDLVLAHGAPPDRYGRIRAQIFLTETDGSHTWIQAELVRAGLARVESEADTRQCAAELLRLEAQARARRRGLWRLRLFSVRRAEEAGRHTGSWQIVEGRIRSIAQVRGRTYVNFGDDWRTDFTISVSPRAGRRFPENFWENKEGRRVRVRGRLERYNGPLIEATHPEQLEWPEKSEEREARRTAVSE
ncbi:MAG: thermonuclease family protein [Alphaproteobacteria bacterium]